MTSLDISEESESYAEMWQKIRDNHDYVSANSVTKARLFVDAATLFLFYPERAVFNNQSFFKSHREVEIAIKRAEKFIASSAAAGGKSVYWDPWSSQV